MPLLVGVQILIAALIVIGELRRPLTQDVSPFSMVLTAIVWIVTFYMLVRYPVDDVE